jgi:hypothetical protein
MAVRATDFALLQFHEDRRPREAAHRQLVHVVEFGSRVDVVEFQHERISLTTINAWVILQICPQAPLPLKSAGAEQPTVALDICATVTSIVLPAIDGEALAADVLARTFLSVAVMEVLKRPGHSAPWAGFHRLRLRGKVRFGPAKLGRGSTPMAIRATHLTLLNLREQCLPADRLVHQRVNGVALGRRVDVIEVEHAWVSLTAVDTCSLAQIRGKLRAEFARASPRQHSVTGYVLCPMRRVVPPTVGGRALLARTVSLPRGTVAQSKNLGLFALAANPTRPHGRFTPQ